jgi:putative sigma-54 modulation protein
MRVIITGRHVEVTDALRRYIETRMRRLERYGARLGDIQVVLGVEKYRHVAEAILALNGARMQAKTSTKEMYVSIDRLVDKISRQTRKRREKLISHKPPRTAAPKRSPRSFEAAPKPPTIKTIRAPLHLLTVVEAVETLAGQPSGLVVFVNASTNRVQIVRRVDYGNVELIDPQPV